jgi:hypothetical protein
MLFPFGQRVKKDRARFSRCLRKAELFLFSCLQYKLVNHKTMTLQAIKYNRGHLEILNQLLLPKESCYEEISNVEDGWNAIRSMKVNFQ